MKFGIFNCSSPSKSVLVLQLVLGNIFICSFINAQNAPVINNVPADITINCPEELPAKVDLEATDDDDQSFPKTISPVDIPAAGDITPVCIRDTIFRVLDGRRCFQ